MLWALTSAMKLVDASVLASGHASVLTSVPASVLTSVQSRSHAR